MLALLPWIKTVQMTGYWWNWAITHSDGLTLTIPNKYNWIKCNRKWIGYRKLEISTAPTKAKSRHPAYSQALNQNEIDTQKVKILIESGRQTVRRLWRMVFGVGVQYVHCVMHKCIMVKLGGKRKTRKACKNKYILRNQRKFTKVGGNTHFFRNKGELYWNSENRGKLQICSR